MIKLFVLVLTVFFAITPNSINDELPGNIQLIKGFKHKRIIADDAIAGQIYKEKGLLIQYEIGTMQGARANPKNKDQYQWYREQIINGRQVNIALTKDNDLIVSFLLGRDGPNTLFVANFYAYANNSQDIADTLLMVLTFDSNAYFSQIEGTYKNN